MSAIRLHVPGLGAIGSSLDLPEGAARHAQVRRVQPGDELELFDGLGRAVIGRVAHMGRREVTVQIDRPIDVLPELTPQIHLALGMPANERMDTLVEKATELGAASFQPLMCERSVLRLAGDRAERKQAHWQGIAVAAAEQCGRALVPPVATPTGLEAWLRQLPAANAGEQRWLLSFAEDARPLAERARSWRDGPATPTDLRVLSGPEGGLSPAEEAAARACGFLPVSLGPRVLRADTAPLVVLSWWGLQS
jgi:16S rRNA (uracil1498-N3)-methyltransferase